MQTIQVLDGRFEVRLISSPAFASYMDHRGFTVRALAAAVTIQLIKDKRSSGAKKCSPSLIGHLRTGHRNTCRNETAVAIERALEAPPGSLFVPRVSHVSRDVQQQVSA